MGRAAVSAFDDFIREAQQRAQQPQEPSFAERLRAINEELRDPAEERREKIEALATQGATEGERDAARRALERIELEEYEDALAHGAA